MVSSYNSHTILCGIGIYNFCKILENVLEIKTTLIFRPNMQSYCISVRETNVFLKMEHIKYILQHLNEVVLEYLWFQYKLCVVLQELVCIYVPKLIGTR